MADDLDRPRELKRRLDAVQAELAETRELLARRSADYERLLKVFTELETEQARRDLHDGFSQTLTGLAYLSHCLAAELSRRESPDAAQAREIENIATAAVERTRGLMNCLSLAGPGSEALEQSLRALASFTKEVHGVPCSVESRANLSAGLGHAGVHLFRLAMDAVEFVVRRGYRSRIVISTVDESRDIVVEVRAKGVDAPAVAGQDLRPNTTRARADLIGANLAVRQETSSTIVVRCSLARLAADAQFRFITGNPDGSD